MSQTPAVSARSLLIAGMSAAVVGAAVVTPVSAPTLRPVTITADAVRLASITSGLEGIIENLAHVGAGIEGAFVNLAGGIEGAFTNLGNGIEGAYTNLIGGIENVVTSLAATINHITTLPDGVQAALKNSYNGLERWPAYLSDWAQFSLGLIPGLWWAAPGIAFTYHTTQPLARAGAYAFADLVGLDFAQLARDISVGIKTSASNAAIYGKAWADSLVAVPPLPPYPGPWPGFHPAAALPAASTAAVAAPQAAAVTSGVENAIKNTYNAVEPWVAWGFELAQWGLGFVPGLWWVAPGISLAYFSIEPLVQAGVYTVADVLGLNFAQIGPDLQQGVQQSVQNFVNYGLAWIQSLIPFPPLPPFPPRPGASVAAAGTLRAAAPIREADAPAAGTDVTPATDEAAVGDGASKAETADAPATRSTTPAVESTTAASDAVTPDAVAPDAVAPVAESAAPVAETVTPAVTEPEVQAPAAGETTQPSRGARPGHRTPAAERNTPTAGGADTSVRPAQHQGGRHRA